MSEDQKSSQTPVSAGAGSEQPQFPIENTQTPRQPQSKSALKKAAKAERYAAAKLERRAREKEAKKEKKRLKAEKRAAGELDEDEDDRERNKNAKRRKTEFGGRVVVDLGFDSLMNAKEIKSLSSQLAYTYSANRQASFPFHLIFTSLSGQTYERLESLGDAGYKRWTSTEWWQEGFERLWSGDSGPSGSTKSNPEGSAPKAVSSEAAASGDQIAADGVQSSVDDIRQKVVYLTADSEDELTELRPDETYIIGGICDHNRYKNLCLNKAQQAGIRTAKLPIGRYLANLPTRKVLTVNQCFEILVKWVETKDWEEALYFVIPKRKFQTGSKADSASNATIVVEHPATSQTGDKDAEAVQEGGDLSEGESQEGGRADE